MNVRANTARPPGKARAPQAPDAELTCTIRTRFSSLGDLVKAMPILVREDGKLFVPTKDAPVRIGDRLTVVFATVDSRASVERAGVVESTTPDRAISGGQAGILLRMLPWDPPPVARTTPPPEPTPFADEEANPFAAEESRNPFAGLDTNMLSLFVECNLKETEGEVSRSYDDIPTYSEPGPAPSSQTDLPLAHLSPVLAVEVEPLVEELEELPAEAAEELSVEVPTVHPKVVVPAAVAARPPAPAVRG
jgi:hypothetical protein